ncbi:hypothetical protein QF038_003108 [Pseudarthrobacter sp. W1I19]|nr:hypothetical protein [Pseudarthrobacter sp. W1I19]
MCLESHRESATAARGLRLLTTWRGGRTFGFPVSISNLKAPRMRAFCQARPRSSVCNIERRSVAKGGDLDHMRSIALY